MALAAEAPLTLEQVVAAADAPHPDLLQAESELGLSLAERDQAQSRQDFNLYLDGALRTGRQPDDGWAADNVARIVARKPLYDFGRSEQAVAAADQAVRAQQAALVDARAARRLDLMGRFFDVLLADLQYTLDNEFMTVAYLGWDDTRDRFELGQVSRSEMLQREASFQDLRERREASQQQVRRTRQALAIAMNRPEAIPRDLAEPALPGNERPLPEYQALLQITLQRNPALRKFDAQIAASDARIAALQAERRPTLDAEVIGGRYSRSLDTRDQISAGLLFNVPLYSGGRVDALLARERATKQGLVAQREKLKLELAQRVLELHDEVAWLRSSARPAADKQIEFRDAALERSRAEYELEIKTTLGTSLAETQRAQLRRKQVEYRLAMALARLDALAADFRGFPGGSP